MSSPTVDDFALTPMEEADRRDFLDLCDDRHLPQPTILTSQLPVGEWRVTIGDPTLAASIPDRMVHHAHRFDLQGDSLRQLRAQRQLAGGASSATSWRAAWAGAGAQPSPRLAAAGAPAVVAVPRGAGRRANRPISGWRGAGTARACLCSP